MEEKNMFAYLAEEADKAEKERNSLFLEELEKRPQHFLYRKEKRYRDETKISTYYRTDTQSEKSCGPMTVNGHRYKTDFKTGECRLYELEEILANKYNSVQRSKRMLKDIFLMNDFDWFCTLTFDEQRLDRNTDAEVFNAYTKYINNIQHQFPTLRYVTVIERHKSDNAIHFHLVIGGVPWRKLGLVNSGKVCAHWATKKDGICSREYFNRTKHLYQLKDTDGYTVYNITSFIYGYTTATRIASREKCASYVMKYVNKDFGSTDFFKKRFYYSKNLNVPDEVTRCVGADFENPFDTSQLAKLDPYFQNAYDRGYVENYNLSWCKIDNETKSYIDKGLIPTLDDTPFD